MEKKYMDRVQIYKGNIIYSVSVRKLATFEDSYLIVKDGKVEDIIAALPRQYLQYPVCDLGKKFIIPGFADMHIHASQFDQRGLGMDKTLIEWLQTYTFVEESKFSDHEYAREVYSRFTDQLIKQGSLCSCIYATVHKQATGLLFEILENKGLKAFIGKVNMDRNCPDGLKEDSLTSLAETEELINRYHHNSRVKPILTPRFVPACSGVLLDGLGKLAQKYRVPIQSHLSENKEEIQWVKGLHPDEPTYSHVYHSFGLFGQSPTLMAHCIYLSEREITLMKENHVIAVHCPDSNLNLASGITPVRKMLDAGIPIVLGTDVGGGHNISMNRAMVSAIQLSKAMSTLHHDMNPLTWEEVFFMATKGGGGFFGKTGSFEKGYWFDALVIDDCHLGNPNLSLTERLQRFIYIGDDRNISDRFVEGKKVG
jgi:guanine deaminase